MPEFCGIAHDPQHNVDQVLSRCQEITRGEARRIDSDNERVCHWYRLVVVRFNAPDAGGRHGLYLPRRRRLGEESAFRFEL
jgi:hypothetical protein